MKEKKKKQCKFILKNGNRCKHHGLVGGYCMIHWNKVVYTSRKHSKVSPKRDKMNWHDIYLEDKEKEEESKKGTL